jgi:hypothetical protein
VSDIETSDLTLGRRNIPDRFAAERKDDAQDSSTTRPEREGLPTSYRMRADAHYVEQLVSRRDRADRAEASRAQSGQGDMAEHEAAGERDRRSDRVMSQVSEEITTIASAAGMLAAETSPLARRVGLELVRAQAWRASWLLKASVIIDGRHRGAMKPTPLGSVVEQLRQGLAPECRLSGVSLHLQASDANAIVAVDVPLVTAGVTGAVIATLGVMGEAEGATIRVVLDAVGHDLRSVEVTQDLVSVPAAAGLRFFDAAWTDRPGGWTAAMGALSARGVAQHMGGTAVFVPGERRGSTIRLSFRAN